MLVVFAQRWWVMAIRGIVALLFGLTAFFWPGVALTALGLLFGGYALVDGILSLTAAFLGVPRTDRWWMLVFEGIAGIVVAVLTIAWPAITVLVLLYMIAAWAVITGAFELWAAFELRRHLTGEWTLILAGIASIVFGVLLMVAPVAGELVLAWWIGGYALAFGILMILLSLRLRQWLRGFRPQLVS